jgi:hypothetical protein
LHVVLDEPNPTPSLTRDEEKRAVLAYREVILGLANGSLQIPSIGSKKEKRSSNNNKGTPDLLETMKVEDGNDETVGVSPREEDIGAERKEDSEENGEKKEEFDAEGADKTVASHEGEELIDGEEVVDAKAEQDETHPDDTVPSPKLNSEQARIEVN